MIKSVIIKCNKKDSVINGALRKLEQENIFVLNNHQFSYRDFGYRELVFSQVTDETPEEEQKQLFTRVMHTLAHSKIWVECVNVTIVTRAGISTEKNSVGARYGGVGLEMSCEGCLHTDKCFTKKSPGDKKYTVCKHYQPMYDEQRYANLSIDGADRLGALNHRKRKTRFDKKRWFTDGVPDEDGDLTFGYEYHGHSECYSNYKHFNRVRFDIIWDEWDGNLEASPKKFHTDKKKCLYEKKEKITPYVPEPASEELGPVGRALVESINVMLKKR